MFYVGESSHFEEHSVGHQRYDTGFHGGKDALRVLLLDHRLQIWEIS
jgi:hypothetical protein